MFCLFLAQCKILYLCLIREIRQKNEGGYVFRWEEEQKPGFLILEVDLPRHLDSSLVDVDLHPTYVSIVIKSKVIRALICHDLTLYSSYV